MELRQLRSFVAVCEELHFQRAARRVNLSQPALSHRIKQLEDAVGTRLLDRDRSGVALTPAGKAFLARAREILSIWDAAVREAREAAGMEPGELRIGYVEYLNLSAIDRSIASFRTENPAVAIWQIEMPTPEAYTVLKEKRIDIGFGVLPAPYPTLKVRKIAEGHWVLVVPESHGFAGRGELPVGALNGHPLIPLDSTLNPPLYDVWTLRFRQAGFAPRIVFETRQVQAALNMVRDGVGLFVVASYIVERLPPGLAALRLSGFDNRIAVGAAWHKDNRARVLHAYLAHLRGALNP